MLPELVAKEALLQALLGKCLRNALRTRLSIARHVVTYVEWTGDGVKAWEAVKVLVGEIVPLSHRKPGVKCSCSQIRISSYIVVVLRRGRRRS